MNNTLYRIIKTSVGLAMACTPIVFSSCEDTVLNLSPVNSLTDETAYGTAERCKLSLIGAYDAVQCGYYNSSTGWSRGYPLGSASIMQGEMRGEDMINRASFFQYTYESTYNASSTQNNISFWNCSFEAINRINVVLEGEKAAFDKGVIDENTYTQYEGELKFLRGVVYHYLLIHFSEPYNLPNLNNDYGLPIYLTPINTADALAENIQVHRATVEDTYSQVLADLKEAADKLPVSNSDNNLTRATRGAAYAFLTRVYLHMRDWANVETYAEKLMQQGNYALEADPITPFTNYTTNQESIFSIENNANDNSSVNGAMFSMFSCRDGARYLVSMSPLLCNDTRWLEDDKRRSEYIIYGTGENVITDYDAYFCDKYRSSTRSDYTPIIRYAEVLLNYAEAAARLNDKTTALKYLNEVRNRALADVASQEYKAEDFATTVDLVEAILFERRVEFLGEGRRWEDIHRLAADDLCPSGGIPAKVRWTAVNGKDAFGFGKDMPERGLKAYDYTDKRFLWPIPVDETTYNSVLASEQNVGW